MNMRTDENGRRIVERREDTPAFASESEERAFWETHTLGGALLDEMGAVEDGFLPPPTTRGRRHFTATGTASRGLRH
jgi:hypothetical protein